MARTSLFLAAAILLSATAGQASAAQCRDAAGKFTACPEPAAQKGPCRDANGKFVKCPRLGQARGRDHGGGQARGREAGPQAEVISPPPRSGGGGPEAERSEEPRVEGASGRQCAWLAPSTTRSTPGSRRGRRAVPLPPLRGEGRKAYSGRASMITKAWA